MVTAEEDDAAASDKRDPRDFALWKRTKPGEPATASWPTPYGRGRPGWHLECSAMAHRYLGETFDIHGGGIDLRFPHHENEQAQSRAAGDGFARYWVHNAWVTVGGEKMSKSLGNSLLVGAVLERTSPVVLRYALGGVHYRSTVEFSDASLDEARAAWERIEGFVRRAVESLGPDGTPAEPEGLGTADDGARPASPRPRAASPAFAAAMDDDLNVSAALAVVHEHVRAGQHGARGGPHRTTSAAPSRQVRAMLDVLGPRPARRALGGPLGERTGRRRGVVGAGGAGRGGARRARRRPQGPGLGQRRTPCGTS